MAEVQALKLWGGISDGFDWQSPAERQHPLWRVYRHIHMADTQNAAVSVAPQPQPEAEEVYRRWLCHLDDEFNRHQAAERRGEIVRDQLCQIFLGRSHGAKLDFSLTTELPLNVLQMSLDPANVTLAAEHYPDLDRGRFARSKPLLWFWQMFDRSPLGLNHWLGIRFRAMLGRHLFAQIGKGVRIGHGVELTYGYNLVVEDRALIRPYVLLDDRAGIRIGESAMIGAYARIYSHSHTEDDSAQLILQPTLIGARSRIGAHTTIPAGTQMADRTAMGPHNRN
jgi:acetyltransferase-like isoleucine patch superfamily enzyme